MDPQRTIPAANLDAGARRRVKPVALPYRQFLLLVAGLTISFPTVLLAQEPEAGTSAVQPQTASPGPLVTVRGLVRNTATSEPLPRALVRIEGDASAGALTDGGGQFEIPNVPAGPQIFRVLKPGYGDPSPGEDVGDDSRGSAMHTILVAAAMPELSFSLEPRCAIHGTVGLSSGDPAHGIGLVLLKRAVQDGRAVWQAVANTRTNSDGNYRLGNLADGTYILFTDPAMDNDSQTSLVSPVHGASIARNGYPTMFYPDAREFAGAARIKLANGEQAQANLMLTLEPFQTVSAQIFSGDGRPSVPDSRFGSPYMVQVTDTAGHQSAYSAQYDPASQTVQAILPDGTYSLQVSTTPSWNGQDGLHSLPPRFSPSLTGSADIAVAGHPVGNVRVVLSSGHGGTVQLRIDRAAAAQATSPQNEEVRVLLSQAGGLFSDGAMNLYASGSEPGTMELSNLVQPGTYWVHAQIAQRSLCEESFTAGGVNLAREPMVLNSSGIAPLDLTLRNDCAKLTLTMPATVSALVPCEEPSMTVFVVPEFDTTEDVQPVTLRASTSSTVTLEGMTPGNYRVYTFSQPVQLEYRNPAALAALQNTGQEITLSPGATGSLVLEVSAQ